MEQEIKNNHRKVLSKDKVLKKIMASQPEVFLEKRNKVYLRLCSSILSQQLSTRVAAILYERFLNLYGGKEPTLAQVASTPLETFRSIGFSNNKANYVHNVCAFFSENKITDTRLHKMENEEVIELLTRIKGVGRWTVEMILMFTLAREDVFAIDDLGLKNAIVKLYGLAETKPILLKKELEQISNQWKPYRTYACLYLWQWSDN